MAGPALGAVTGRSLYRIATRPARVGWVDEVDRAFPRRDRGDVEQAAQFAADVAELRSGWHERLATWRAGRGIRERPRSGSAVARLVELLPEMPVMTTRTVQRLLELSFPSARAAVEELAEGGILARRRIDRGTTGYLATEVFDLLTFAERRLASTRWDARRSGPVRAVPARPQPRPV